MSSLQLRGSSRFGGGRNSISFAALLVLTTVSALTGAVAALMVQRLVQRHQYIEVLPQREDPPRLEEPQAASNTARGPSVAPDLAHRRIEESPLGPVSSHLTAARIAELERLLAEDDVVAGDGTDTCPAEFPIKANGRSGIYHWPGATAYAHTRPTLCFKDRDAAERAGFRPAKS